MTYVTVIDAVIDAVYLCSVPSALMLALSLIAFAIVVEPTLVAALQHLAAGIVLSAVAVELVPTILASPRDFSTTFGMTVGFFCGIAFFLVLSKFVGEDDDDKDSDDEEGPATSYMEMDAHGRTRSSSLPTASEEVKLAAAKKLSKVGTMKALSTVTTTPAAPPPFPIVLSTAVAVDALVDGLLIGISSASGGTKAGVVIAAALSIEMSFLGLTFASSIKQQPAHRRLIAIIVPPLLLVAGGALGGSLGALLASTPPLHMGLVSFGVAALLYLVTEELLLEAHHNHDEEHVWWVDAMFFVGFYLSFLLEKYSSAPDA